MIGIVDRFEGNIVVIETDEKMYNVDIELTDGTLKEGDVVELIIQDDYIIEVRKKVEETQSREEYINDLVKDMWE
ncbi:MAG: DUF3006 domain-containing protein [Clostridia bacterium]|nr:DUF3006 domain-containing protein [Clostridia bacterium]